MRKGLLAKILGAVLLFVCVEAKGKPLQCAEFGFAGIERPEKPSCIGYPFNGDDSIIEECRSEIESYRSRINSYLDCLVAESNEVRDEFNSTVRTFNCSVGGSYC
jgi:hypothetical protein